MEGQGEDGLEWTEFFVKNHIFSCLIGILMIDILNLIMKMYDSSSGRDRQVKIGMLSRCR